MTPRREIIVGAKAALPEGKKGISPIIDVPNLQILTVLESQISDELTVELKSKHPHLLIDEVKMIDGVRVGVDETAPNE